MPLAPRSKIDAIYLEVLQEVGDLVSLLDAVAARVQRAAGVGQVSWRVALAIGLGGGVLGGALVAAVLIGLHVIGKL